MSDNITIRDVAKKAGVSITTVSRVLNGHSNVKEETRDLVLNAADELGFQPNSFAQTLIAKRSKMIATIMPGLTDEFHVGVIKGIENVLYPLGYHQLIFTTENNRETELEIADSLFVRMADGVILTPVSNDPELLKHFGDNLVLVDKYNPGTSTAAVVVDDFGGAYQIVSLLVKNGHEKIAIINGNDDFAVGRDRKTGYCSALLQAGINIRADYVCSGDWSERCGYDNMKQLMSLTDPPTAVFCASCDICMGAIKYLSDHDLKIAEDVSLVGFDDNVLAGFVRPGVTVVSRAVVEMGERASRMLLSMIEDKSNSKGEVVTLETKIIERGSIKKMN